MTADLRVYLVTDPHLGGGRPLERTVELAVAGGVTLVLVRDKTADLAGLEKTARGLLDVLDGTGVPLIVNDSLAVAAAVGAGLHVGRADAAPMVARQVLGPDAVIGVSLYGGRTLTAAETEILDYTAIGPVWATDTKRDAGEPVGLAALSSAAAFALPVVGIGGIDAVRAGEVVRAGGAGVAVVSAVVAVADPRAAARALRLAVDQAMGEGR